MSRKSPSTRTRLTGAALPAILVLALLLRLVYIHQMRHDPFFQHLIVNAASFDAAGRDVAAGSWSEGTAYFQPPLYPYFLGAVYRLFGHAPQAARHVQAVLGMLACLLIYLLGKRLSTPAVGLLAAAGASIYWTFIFYAGELLPTALSVTLSLLALWLFYVAADGRRPFWWFAAGLSLGLGALVRPNLLFCLPFLAAAILLFRPFGRSFLRASVLYLCGAALAVLPVTLRNFADAGEFVLVSANAGHNLYLGNREAADGLDPFPDQKVRALLDEMAEKGLGNGAQSGRLMALAVRWIRQNPGRALSLLLKKLVLWWNAHEIPNNRDLDHARSRSALLGLPWLGFGLIGPLGIVGAVLSARTRRAAPLLIYLAAYTASILPFFVCSRFRLPMIPILLLFAVSFLIGIPPRWRRCLKSERTKCLGVIALLAGAALLVNGNFYNVRTTTFFEIEYNTGWVLSQSGDYEGAVAGYERALAIDRRVEALGNLGLVYQRLGHPDRALALYREAIEKAPRSALHAYNNSGLILKGRGDFPEAIAMFEKAVRLDPGYLSAHVNLADCYYQTGRREEALRELDTSLALSPAADVRERLERARTEWSR